MSIIVLRTLSALGGIALAAAILWAFGLQPFWEGVDVVTSSPWGQVTLIDLYLGFFLHALIIWTFERSMAWRLIWVLPIFVLGNVWTVVWFVARAPQIIARLRNW
ncbi:MAG: hypothetical protein AAFY73_02210 [Pseudomonadota bacterium]